jgi:hypothetical protein
MSIIQYNDKIYTWILSWAGFYAYDAGYKNWKNMRTK